MSIHPRLTRQQRLWQTVLMKAALDATSDWMYSAADRYAKREADRWFRHSQRDFQTVCALAGMDPDFIREAYIDGRINAALLRAKDDGAAQ